MGAIRAYAKRRHWSDAEKEYLRSAYATTPWADMEEAIGTNRSKIYCQAQLLGLVRAKNPRRTEEETREAKRAWMARRWVENPEIMRAKAREFRARNRDRINAATRESTAKRIFWARALRLRGGISARDLARIWREQKGRCALTGRKLDRTAEIDHRLPKARGGTDDLSNLRWVTREANRAKRDLTDAEFAALCRDCAEWIGERIAAVDALSLSLLAAE